MSRNDDTTIVVRNAIDGDDASLAVVVARFTPLLMAQARHRLRRHLRDHYTPADLVQDTWRIALPKLRQLRERASRITPVLLRFLSGVLVNRYGTLLQKLVLGKPLIEAAEAEAMPASGSTVFERATRHEDVETVRRCLEELDDRDQQVIVLRAIEQASNAEAAALLGLSPQQVAVVYQRSLGKLKSRLPNSVFAELTASEDDGGLESGGG